MPNDPARLDEPAAGAAPPRIAARRIAVLTVVVGVVAAAFFIRTGQRAFGGGPALPAHLGAPPPGATVDQKRNVPPNVLGRWTHQYVAETVDPDQIRELARNLGQSAVAAATDLDLMDALAAYRIRPDGTASYAIKIREEVVEPLTWRFSGNVLTLTTIRELHSGRFSWNLTWGGKRLCCADWSIVRTTTGEPYCLDRQGGPEADRAAAEGEAASTETPPAAGEAWRDPGSGLTWQAHPVGGMWNWWSAQAYCQSLDLDGHRDWRLPTISELRSLVRGCPTTQRGGRCHVADDCRAVTCRNFSCDGWHAEVPPAMLGMAFWPREVSGPVDWWYWSATEASINGIDAGAWAVHFGNAEIDYAADRCYTRCVR